MKEPDPPEDYEQLFLEGLDELQAEAQITPIDLEFPPEVIECLEVYTKEHSLDRAELLNLAIDAHVDPTGCCWVEVVERLTVDPDPFDWPLENPLGCVLIAFMRKLAGRWRKKCTKNTASPMTSLTRPTGGKPSGPKLPLELIRP